MRFFTLAALVASAAAVPNVTLYSDDACTKKVQTLSFNNQDKFQCFNTFSAKTVKGAIFSGDSYANKGFGVWDADYCAGDAAGPIQKVGKCLSASYYGLQSWKSAHISPRNGNPQSHG